MGFVECWNGFKGMDLKVTGMGFESAGKGFNRVLERALEGSGMGFRGCWNRLQEGAGIDFRMLELLSLFGCLFVCVSPLESCLSLSSLISGISSRFPFVSSY